MSSEISAQRAATDKGEPVGRSQSSTFFSDHLHNQNLLKIKELVTNSKSGLFQEIQNVSQAVTCSDAQ